MSPAARKLFALARAEWRLRQQSTFLGFLWTLLHPALMFAVLYGLFSRWLGRAPEGYALFLLAGLVQWNFFASASSYALSSLLRRAGLARSYPLPHEVPVLAAVLSVYFSHLLELCALAAIAWLWGGGPFPALHWLLAADAVFLLLAAGAGLLLAALNVFFSDTERVWTILLTAGFFLTPVFYPLSQLEPWQAAALARSPLALLLDASRAALAGAPVQAGGLLAAAGWALAVFAAGLALLRLNRRAIGDAL